MFCSSRRSLSDVPTRDQIPTIAVTRTKSQAAVSTNPHRPFWSLGVSDAALKVTPLHLHPRLLERTRQQTRAAAGVETRASNDEISAAHPASFEFAQAPGLILAAGAPDRADGRARPERRKAGAQHPTSQFSPPRASTSLSLRLPSRYRSPLRFSPMASKCRSGAPIRFRPLRHVRHHSGCTLCQHRRGVSLSYSIINTIRAVSPATTSSLSRRRVQGGKDSEEKRDPGGAGVHICRNWEQVSTLRCLQHQLSISPGDWKS
ncbi:hypothetical protein LXA43DRAFT_1097355 [Ganoderma leucocontextum]|nr:hypothetical protein LXA43DRAFT_1097355 [Ganoderma leucocontextum]